MSKQTGKSMLGKFWYVFNVKQKFELLLLLIMAIFGAFAEMVSVTAVLPFISMVLNPEALLENKYVAIIYNGLGFHSSENFVIFLAVALIVIYILKNIYVFIMHSMQYSFTYNNQRKLSYDMLKCYMYQPYLYHVEHNRAELSRNVYEDVNSFFLVVLAVLQLISEASVCIALFFLLLYQDRMITMGVIFLALIFGGAYVLISKRRLAHEGENERNRLETTRQIVLEALGGIKEIKVFGREQNFLDAYQREYKEYAESYRQFKMYTMLPKPVMETICISGLLLIIAVKLYAGASPETFIPTLSLFAVAAFRLLPSANRMAEYTSRIMYSKPAVEAIYFDLKEIEENLVSKNNQKGTEENLHFNQEIEVQNVGFAYPNTERFVFRNINFTIPKNTSVALIGESGGGKTTMADIILGILEPQEGAVLVDGIEIKKGMKSWKHMIGYIPQTISLLDASIRDNILFGTPDEEVDEQRLEQAVKESQLYRFITNLDAGMDTIIGEGGVRLSGGQRQRIGIARALYHNPEILILDEATSALDNDTETAVMEAIDCLAGSKTLVIIAHRLSTIQNCDTVYKIEKGIIAKVKKGSGE